MKCAQLHRDSIRPCWAFSRERPEAGFTPVSEPLLHDLAGMAPPPRVHHPFDILRLPPPSFTRVCRSLSRPLFEGESECRPLFPPLFERHCRLSVFLSLLLLSVSASLAALLARNLLLRPSSRPRSLPSPLVSFIHLLPALIHSIHPVSPHPSLPPSRLSPPFNHLPVPPSLPHPS